MTEMLAVMRRAAVKEGGAVLTVDALITDLDGNEALIDQTVIHHTAKSYLGSCDARVLNARLLACFIVFFSKRHRALHRAYGERTPRGWPCLATGARR